MNESFAGEVSVARTTTVQRATDATAAYVAGFVCGEGSFDDSGNRFRFSLTLGASDRTMCELLQAIFGVGHVRWYPRRKPHYDDEVVFHVQRLRDLVEVVVPFMDEHLTASFKREQYERWRSALLEYWETKARRRRACSIEGCDRPNRSRGLCRQHYYAEYGA